MSAHEDAYQQFMDKFALRELVMTYCRAADRRDFTLMRSLYHDDATDDHGQMFSGKIDEFMIWVAGFTKQFEATRHEVSNTLFKVAGDFAEGETYAFAYHRTFAPDAREIVGGGRYLDRFERRQGVWKILHRSVAIDWENVRPVDLATYAQLPADYVGRPDERDPSYRALSMFGRGMA